MKHGRRRRQPGDFIHDFARMRVAPLPAKRIREELRRLPVGVSGLGTHDAADALDAALRIDEDAILFEKARAGKKDMRVIRRLIEEDSWTTRHSRRAEPRRHMFDVRVRLQNVFALDIEALEPPSTAASNMLGMRKPGSLSSCTPQSLLEEWRTASLETWR